MHFFGVMGIMSFALGAIIESYLLVEKIMGNDIGHRPLFFVGMLFLVAGIQLITVGFIAEILVRTYYESQNKKPYKIVKTFIGNKEE